jgi:predicted Zn-dependent protease
MAAAILTGSNAIGQLANVGAQAWMMGYGRENEMEADRLGMKYMVKAGYNPESIGKVFATGPARHRASCATTASITPTWASRWRFLAGGPSTTCATA